MQITHTLRKEMKHKCNFQDLIIIVSARMRRWLFHVGLFLLVTAILHGAYCIVSLFVLHCYTSSMQASKKLSVLHATMYVYGNMHHIHHNCHLWHFSCVTPLHLNLESLSSLFPCPDSSYQCQP